MATYHSGELLHATRRQQIHRQSLPRIRAEAILQDYKEIGDALWKRFNVGKEGTLWYYGKLSEQFNALLPGRLANRLNAAVSGFSGK